MKCVICKTEPSKLIFWGKKICKKCFYQRKDECKKPPDLEKEMKWIKQGRRREIAARYGNYCMGCFKSFSERECRYPHIDHIFPKSAGGVNARWNLQPMCSRCNSKKADSYDHYSLMRHNLLLDILS